MHIAHVNALSPPIAGERVRVEGWGGNGHLLEAYSTEPTCSQPHHSSVSIPMGMKTFRRGPPKRGVECIAIFDHLGSPDAM